MPELLLNSTWLGIVLLGFARLWRIRLSPQIRDRRLEAFLAVAGMLMLLLPVISATDDLHSSVFTADEGYSTQKLVKAAQTGHRSTVIPVIPPLILRSFAQSQYLQQETTAVVPPDSHPNAYSLTETITDRAPPAVTFHSYHSFL